MEQIFLALAFIMIPLMMLWHSRKKKWTYFCYTLLYFFNCIQRVVIWL